MGKTLILNARIITAQKVLPNYCVEITDGKISRIFPCDQLDSWEKDTEIFDSNGAYLSAGLVDMHIHGFAGYGPELNTPQALLKMSELLAQQGVTAFCPTLYCNRPQEMLRTVENTVEAFGQEKGAHLLGYHLEGPFISPQKPGVMKPQDISPIDIPALEKIYHAASGHIANITAAPELPNISSLVDFCREKNILLQAGPEALCEDQLISPLFLSQFQPYTSSV